MSQNAAKSQEASAAINDFGEKIGGARKDAAASMREALVDKRLSGANAFPIPNYAKLKAAGFSDEELTQLRSLRDAYMAGVTGKLGKYASTHKGYAERVAKAREYADKILSGEKISAEAIAKELPSGDAFLARIKLYDRLGADAKLPTLSVTEWGRTTNGKTLWEISDGKRRVMGNSLDDAVENYAKLYKPREAAQRGKITADVHLYTAGENKGKYLLQAKMGAKKESLTGEDGKVILFDTAEEARAFANDQAKLQEVVGRMRPDTKLLPSREFRPREGTDWRKGRNITEKDFDEAFGFRGVEFGNWVNNATRQADLNAAYDSLMDLAELLGVKAQSLTMGGRLGFAFGARGSGKFAAHYEPLREVINLTKTKGFGAIAHEWFHALDNYFGKLENAPTTALSNTGAHASEWFHSRALNVRPEVYKAWRELSLTLEQTDMAKASSRAGAYWAKPRERAARAWESYIEGRLASVGKTNDGLVTPHTSALYPSAKDMQALKPKFDALFKALNERASTKAGAKPNATELYSSAQAGGAVVGAQAGWEKDEDGNWRYNATKGAIGAAGGFAVGRKLDRFNGGNSVRPAYVNAKNGENLTKPAINSAKKGELAQGQRASVINASPQARANNEAKKIGQVQYGDKPSTIIRKDLMTVENAIKFEKGNSYEYGARHIDKHLRKDKNGWVLPEELARMGEVIRKHDKFEISPKNGNRVYTWYNKDNVRFKSIVGYAKEANGKVTG
jgi:hypothetical protein